jgi:outer membrane protein TolC
MATELQAQRGILLQVREAYYGLEAARARADAAGAMAEHAASLRDVTEAARVQYIGTDYKRMLLLEDEPKLMEFKVVPDVPDQVEADIIDSNARVSRLQAALELSVAQARLARALGVRSLSEVRP